MLTSSFLWHFSRNPSCWLYPGYRRNKFPSFFQWNQKHIGRVCCRLGWPSVLVKIVLWYEGSFRQWQRKHTGWRLHWSGWWSGRHLVCSDTRSVRLHLLPSSGFLFLLTSFSLQLIVGMENKRNCLLFLVLSSFFFFCLFLFSVVFLLLFLFHSFSYLFVLIFDGFVMVPVEFRFVHLFVCLFYCFVLFCFVALFLSSFSFYCLFCLLLLVQFSFFFPIILYLYLLGFYSSTTSFFLPFVHWFIVL